MGNKRLSTLLDKQAKEGTERPNLETLCKAFLVPVGGLPGLIKRVWKVIDALDDGHPTQARLLTQLLDLMQLTAEQRTTAGALNFDEFSPEDLRRLVEGIDHDRLESSSESDADETQSVGAGGEPERTAVDSEEFAGGS